MEPAIASEEDPHREQDDNDDNDEDARSDTTSVILRQMLNDEDGFSISSSDSSDDEEDSDIVSQDEEVIMDEDLTDWCDDTIVTNALHNDADARFVFEGIPSDLEPVKAAGAKLNKKPKDPNGFLDSATANNMLEQLDKKQLIFMMQALCAANGVTLAKSSPDAIAQVIARPVAGPAHGEKAPGQFAKVVEYQPIMPPWHKENSKKTTSQEETTRTTRPALVEHAPTSSTNQLPPLPVTTSTVQEQKNKVICVVPQEQEVQTKPQKNKRRGLLSRLLLRRRPKQPSQDQTVAAPKSTLKTTKPKSKSKPRSLLSRIARPRTTSGEDKIASSFFGTSATCATATASTASTTANTADVDASFTSWNTRRTPPGAVKV